MPRSIPLIYVRSSSARPASSSWLMPKRIRSRCMMRPSTTRGSSPVPVLISSAGRRGLRGARARVETPVVLFIRKKMNRLADYNPRATVLWNIVHTSDLTQQREHHSCSYPLPRTTGCLWRTPFILGKRQSRILAAAVRKIYWREPIFGTEVEATLGSGPIDMSGRM